MTDSLPCIKCGTVLQRVADDCEAQPDGGIMLTSNGNYGSTVFDDFNGNVLLFNLCDECLVNAGVEGRVLTGRDWVPVTTDIVIGDRVTKSRVGARQTSSPLVTWNKDIPGLESTEHIEITEIARYLDNPEYRFSLAATDFEQILREVEAHDAVRESLLCKTCDLPQEHKNHSAHLFDGYHDFVAPQ